MITIEDIEKRQEHIERLKTAILHLLGDKYDINITGDILGACMAFKFYRKNPPNNYVQNSPVYMHFIMHLQDKYNKLEPLQKVSFELLSFAYQLKNNGVKYRKISSTKSISDAINKLVDWFHKNMDVIEQTK